MSTANATITVSVGPAFGPCKVYVPRGMRVEEADHPRGGEEFKWEKAQMLGQEAQVKKQFYRFVHPTYPARTSSPIRRSDTEIQMQKLKAMASYGHGIDAFPPVITIEVTEVGSTPKLASFSAVVEA